MKNSDENGHATGTELREICKDILEGMPDKVNNYRLGKTGLIGMFCGEAMIKTRGKADPIEMVKIFKELLNE